MNEVDNKRVYAVIMAGGTGKLLWPLARKKTPKQFVDLFDKKTMIDKTIQRIAGIVNTENIFIITNEQGKVMLLQSDCRIDPENIIVEPMSRNTAPCIALATAYIKKKDPDAVTIILPSDHLVIDEEKFLEILQAGIRIAAKKTSLVTIGINPDHPETNYGYIQADRELYIDPSDCGDYRLYKVKTFAEKPDYATAVQFLESKDFFWNSGMFIWHIDMFSKEIERSLPDLHRDFLNIYENIDTHNESEIIEDVYSWIHPISVDYGIMEKAESVYMLEGEFGWTDLGNWDQVAKVSVQPPYSAASREKGIVMIDCEQMYIRKPKDKVVCLIGTSNLIVVDTGDALLICNKGDSHKVGTAFDQLRRDDFDSYL
ncbi:mannose-1-phosphate guanylyltransferase [Chlorobium phaeobacteroides]|uniref:mannose-1-phosphate guanylyltransferase n=1 Tax=Chlorobium phaeobacteroides (strain DSM 266 / SMG 266 / 2430) TaxID=290317 RepID=A1BJ04_CHLPD|nr:mannose-1-phosphate guanylyltransferase [Chlorobium phaeobacteroides]ABL66381.1 mannose-6-phosphate isomerase, type 2 / mannose-1-phosphate guanylyltransferase (GDP) [Chlorobium phaeobacteroides DSM 266]